MERSCIPRVGRGGSGPEEACRGRLTLVLHTHESMACAFYTLWGRAH